MQSEFSDRMTDEMADGNDGMPELDDISQLGKKVTKNILQHGKKYQNKNANSGKVRTQDWTGKVLTWPGLAPEKIWQHIETLQLLAGIWSGLVSSGLAWTGPDHSEKVWLYITPF